MAEMEFNSPEREKEIHHMIGHKTVLRKIYLEHYKKFKLLIKQCPSGGKIVELGSGGGFIKEIIPEAITSDVISYPSVDMIVDSTHMQFEDNSISAFLMMNVFHHIPDVEAFLTEATRCLKPGGRVLII